MPITKNLLSVFILFSSFTAAAQDTAPAYVQYYFVELIQNDSATFNPEEARKIQMAHMANIKRMAEEGKLLLAGPFADGGGLFILNTSAQEEAEAWIREDPAVKAGRFKFRMRLWITEKGLLSLEN